MGKKKKQDQRILVDKEKFTEIVKQMVNSAPIKREDVKGSSPKAGKVIEKT